MSLRFVPIFPFIAFISASLFAQVGVYGPVTNHVKAGDAAPDIQFTKQLNSPGSSTWTSADFEGPITVLAFFPDTSHNPQLVATWNRRVADFTSKSVQFVWVTGETETSLLPSLAQSPIKGWVLFDPDGATGRAYGQEIPSTVIIGTDGKILGFTHQLVPGADVLNAALEGRITTTRPKPGEVPAPGPTAHVHLDSEPWRMPRPGENKPSFPPSYELHVSPSQGPGTGDIGGDDYWSLEGLDLKGALSQVFGLSAVRIDLPTWLDKPDRYDFSMVVPDRESKKRLMERFQQGILDHFGITAVTETPLMDVYVVTASNPKLQVQRSSSAESLTRVSSFDFELDQSSARVPLDSTPHIPRISDIRKIKSVSIHGTIKHFCDSLEWFSDRPVINETGLKGVYDIDVPTGENLPNDFITRLRDQTGLVITPAQRSVEILVVRPR